MLCLNRIMVLIIMMVVSGLPVAPQEASAADRPDTSRVTIYDKPFCGEAYMTSDHYGKVRIRNCHDNSTLTFKLRGHTYRLACGEIKWITLDNHENFTKFKLYFHHKWVGMGTVSIPKLLNV